MKIRIVIAVILIIASSAVWAFAEDALRSSYREDGLRRHQSCSDDSSDSNYRRNDKKKGINASKISIIIYTIVATIRYTVTVSICS